MRFAITAWVGVTTTGIPTLASGEVPLFNKRGELSISVCLAWLRFVIDFLVD
jgi:hypothetical protein